MAVVKGIRERVHLPIYDSLSVEPRQQIGDDVSSGIIKFFVDVQGKTKIETNLQSASLLPHYNTFEARAMRVVISDLPPQFPDDRPEEPNIEGLTVFDGEDEQLSVDNDGNIADDGDFGVVADFTVSIGRAMDLIREAQESEDGIAIVFADDPDIELSAENDDGDPPAQELSDEVAEVGAVELTIADLEGALLELPEEDRPPIEQVRPNDGAGTVIGRLIYNTVTTFYVGEKVMIQMPTWFFPAGAGPYSESAKFTTHGEPSPTATFRFAEPISIDKQQNFRVEMEIPNKDVLDQIQRIYGPLNIWVVLDGYMTRDVQ